MATKQHHVTVKTHFTQQQNEYIWQLMYEKVAGIIHPKDQQFLEKQLEKDDCMREALEALEISLKDADTLDLQQLREDEEWRDILPELKPRPSMRKPVSLSNYAKAAIAAVIAGILAGAGYYLLQQKKAAPVAPIAKRAAVPAEKPVMLQLADDHTVSLSGPQKDIDLGDVQLHNDKGILTFKSSNGFTHSGQHTLIVPEGKEYKLVLPDGSEIWLNAATRLQFPFHFNGNAREVTLLSGEAYVKVAPNAKQPFIVHTANSIVQVLGTEFNINSYQQDVVKLALINGAVKMQSQTTSTVIKPGMEAVCSNKELYTRSFDERAVSGWRNGAYYFENAPIQELCVVLSRNFGITAVIDSGSQAGSRRFTGMANKRKPLSELMQDLQNINIRYNIDKEGVLHFK